SRARRAGLDNRAKAALTCANRGSNGFDEARGTLLVSAPFPGNRDGRARVNQVSDSRLGKARERERKARALCFARAAARGAYRIFDMKALVRACCGFEMTSAADPLSTIAP